jgi:hypothetical protein
MGRLRSSRSLSSVCALFLIVLLPACGGHKPAGASPNPVRVTLTPSISYSMQVGSVILLTASAANAANTVISPAFSFNSTNPDIVDVAPGGAACAGKWNAPLYSTCTPNGIGTAYVTATAVGVTSPSTLIFVHAPIDTIQVSVVPQVNSPPPACPGQQPLPLACALNFTSTNACLSQNQVETLQATAFSNGADITSSVGPFTWTEFSPSVTTITPIITSSYHVATNQATAAPGAPGQTQVIASSSGVSSQPYYFETCPVQCIAMQLGVSGSQNSTVTNFVTTKGTSETITATAVDVQGCVVPKPPLTWISSSPAALSAGGTSGCSAGTTCTIAATQTGSAAITASCSPPTCNIGWPLNPTGLPANSIFIPEPVYPVTTITGLVTPATSSSSGSGSSGSGSSGSGSSGSGSSGSGSSGSGSSGSGSSGSGSSGSGSSASSSVTTSVLVSSQDCYTEPLCTVGLYNISTTSAVSGGATPMAAPPNSLMFDAAGDHAFMGSQFGAVLVSPANLGSTTGAFTALAAPGTERGVVIGRVIGVSPSGGMAIFSDTVDTPNQVYVATVTTTTTTPSGSSSSSSSTPSTQTTSSTVALNINNATAATFSPDGLKAFILANGGTSLYIYSFLEALQPPITLTGPASSVVFSSSGSFALLSGGIAPATYPGTFSIYNTCDNSQVTLTPPSATPTLLPSPPLFLKMVPAGNVPMGNSVIPTPLDTTGLDFFFGLDNTGIDIIATNTSLPSVPALCPQPVTLAHTPAPANTPFQPVHVNIGQGTFTPINFFISPSTTQAYIVASDRNSILVYNFSTGATTGIPLVNNATPTAADITADGTLIYVAGSDGLLHQVSTVLAIDQNQISFSPLPNSTNGFCFNANNCQLDLLAVRP